MYLTAVLGTRLANHARSVRAGSCDSFLINRVLKAKDGMPMGVLLREPRGELTLP